MSGGWNPNVHLTCHQGGRPVWRDDIAAFTPGDNLPVGMTVAGAANGSLGLAGALAEGGKAGNVATQDIGYSKSNYTELLTCHIHSTHFKDHYLVLD